MAFSPVDISLHVLFFRPIQCFEPFKALYFDDLPRPITFILVQLIVAGVAEVDEIGEIIAKTVALGLMHMVVGDLGVSFTQKAERVGEFYDRSEEAVGFVSCGF